MVKLFVFFSLLSMAAQAQETTAKAKYEVGFAVGSVYLPDYPGSKEMKGYVIPLPYVIYRGDFLKADRDGGLRGQFFNSEKFELDLGFGGGFPSDSEENEARDGMDELDWTGEVGPRAKWKLINNSETRFLLLVPIRYVFSIDFPDTQHQGWVLNPELNLRQDVKYFKNTRIFATAGFSVGTKKLMEYFYTVEPGEATPTRPAYEAEAGYWATNISLLIGKRFPDKNFNIVGGLSWNIYEGSENVKSPLITDRYTTSYFLGIAMGLWESEERGFSN